MAKQIVHPQGSYPTAGYARGVRAGDTLYLAGHIARRPDGQVVAGDVAAQAEQVFRNLGEVLAAAGADFSALVKMTIYALEPEYRLPILAVRDRYCQPGTFASTFVVPRALASPDLLVEIEAVAYLGD
ncbi:MAG TPA: RidA family protein [Thermomicrobiaceae bacterium]|nr:RidA family protein [Thermomicrobiaceae bacterium]